MGSGPPPGLVFDSDKSMLRRNGRSVFRPAKDAVLFSLNHPVIQQALLLLSRARYRGTEESQLASRWTVCRDHVPPGAEAVVVALTVAELAVNERRETFHPWVRTLRFPIVNGSLGQPLPHVPASEDRRGPLLARHEPAVPPTSRSATCRLESRRYGFMGTEHGREARGASHRPVLTPGR